MFLCVYIYVCVPVCTAYCSGLHQDCTDTGKVCLKANSARPPDLTSSFIALPASRQETARKVVTSKEGHVSFSSNSIKRSGLSDCGPERCLTNLVLTGKKNTCLRRAQALNDRAAISVKHEIEHHIRCTAVQSNAGPVRLADHGQEPQQHGVHVGRFPNAGDPTWITCFPLDPEP